MSINLPKNRQESRLFAEEAMPHLKALYGLAFRLAGSQNDAEDLVQETFVKAYQKYDQFSPGTNLRAWLARIMTNTFINGYRKKQRERLGTEADNAGAENVSPESLQALYQLTSTLESSGSPEGSRAPWLREHLQKAFAQLQEDYRAVVLLADVEGLPYKEIAQSLGVPIGTVMSRLYRGRRQLQRELLEQARDFGIVDDSGVDEHEISEPLSLEAFRRRGKKTEGGVG